MASTLPFEPVQTSVIEKTRTQRPTVQLALGLLIVFAIVGLLATPTRAYENHQMWEKVRVQGKLCMKSHEHYGKSPPWVSKRGAIAYAHRQWESFTTWEYGKAWGKLRLAVGKRQRCQQISGRWVCSIIARPCRR